jgi:hypothetical protein
LFSNCTALESIEIPDGVTKIDIEAFSGCTSLESIYIPSSVTNIAQDAFASGGLQSICAEAGSSAETFALDNGIAIIYYGIEYNVRQDGTVEITGINYKPTNLTIPSQIDGNTVTSIAKRAFYNNTDIVNVTLPDTITLIDNAAFFNCYNLESVNIPDGVTKIGRSAFFGCGKLGDVFIPASVTEIVADAFFGCGSMDTITGYLDTAAQDYAEAYDFNFVYLDVITKGDFNTDGTVDINDIGGIMFATTYDVKITNKQRLSGDLNDDGVVDAFDAAAVDRGMA